MINTAKEYLNIDLRGHLDLVNYYNLNCLQYIKPSRKYTMNRADNWCAMFTTCIANMCGISAKEFPYEVSVTQQVAICKERGWYFNDANKAEANDLAFFDWKGNGTFAHVGFVFSTDGSTITTIEGNHNGTVAFRKLAKTSRVFAGFARTPSQCVERGGDIAKIARDVLKGRYGNGKEREEKLGSVYKEVQEYINKM